MRPLTCILAATDFSAAADRAALIAREHGAELYLLHVVPPLTLYAGQEIDARPLDEVALTAAGERLGPLAKVLAEHYGIRALLPARQDSVAMRAPRHPVAQGLLRAFGSGLAAPSANPYGRVSPTEARHVRMYFPELSLLDGGPCRHGLESTIISLLGVRPRALRPGALPLAALRKALGGMGIETGDATGSSPRVPGAMPAHYAPVTPLELHDGAMLARRAEDLRAQGMRVALLCIRQVLQDSLKLRLLPRFFFAPKAPCLWSPTVCLPARD